MEAFLERFYDEVDDNLGDPHSQKRYTRAARYRDLCAIQTRLFERFLNLSGQESQIGRVELDIEIIDGQEFYELPEGFRQFQLLEKRTDGDPDQIEARLWTVPTYSSEPGVEIVTGQRGFRIQPIPDSIVAGTWTFIFNKAPVMLHYATTTVVSNLPDEQVLTTYTVSTPVAGTNRITKTGAFSSFMLGETVSLTDGALTEDVTREITAACSNYIEFEAVTGLDSTAYMTIDANWCWVLAGTPGTDAGEIVKLDGYYAGCLLRVFAATSGAPSAPKTVLAFEQDPVTSTIWHFKLRAPWATVPSGSTQYEILPELPYPHDSLYAMDVAMLASSRRDGIRKRAGLALDRHEIYEAARSYFMNTTMDRQPSRILPPRYVKPDPYGGGVV